jgi:transcriptional regulator CtsR
MVNATEKINVGKSLCLVMIGFISVAEATVPPIPKGIFSMPPWETNGYPDQILNDPRIVGLDLVGGWADIEATEGVYDWSSVDSELVKAEAHGKKVLLRIVSGGINVPDWLLADPNVQTFTFIDTNPYHSTYGEELTIPVFWDPIFLDKKIALIQAAGAHFAGHSNIEVVACAFANATSADWNIPQEPEDIQNWLAAGYTTQLMVNTGETTIDATMAAFPNQNVTLSLGLEPDGLNPDQYYLPETVVNYATTTYGRFIAQRNALAAFTPDPVDTSVLFTWQIVFDQCPNVAAQMLYYVSGDDTYRMNGGVPGNPGQILLNAVILGTHYGTQYQEIYENDLKDPALSSVIDAANALLTATPPPPPMAPSNVNGTASDPWSVNLTWRDNANNELGYRIESKIGSTGTYELVTTLGPNTTSTTITHLLEGTQYYFRLQGVNAGGRSAYSNEKSVTTILTSPGSLTAQALSSSQVLLNWTDRSATESGFKIERSPVTNTNYTEIATVGPNTTSFTDSGLSEATKYWYRVRAYNADTTSDYSNERQVTTLHNIPAPPSGLTITSLLSNKVTLSWSDNSDNELHFKIQRKQGVTGTYTDIKTTGANVTGYTDKTGLRDGTLYYYRVRASNAAGDSPYSNEASGTTPLAKPTSATATAVSSSEIDLTWIDNSVSETGYKIERKTGTTGDYHQIALVGANTRNFQDNGLDPNTKYFYRIRATNGTIDSDYSNETHATTFLDRPAAPSNLTITSLLSDRVSLSWTDNSNNETGFKIQRKEGVAGTYTNIKTTGANVTSYTDRDTALRDGTLFYYRVAATNGAGDSPFSNEASGTTPLAKPTSADATAVSSSQINLTWVDNSVSETGYKIERKRTSTGTYQQIAQVGANVQHYSDTNGLEPNTRYYYRVRATNGTLNSDYSNETSATTFR